MSQTPPNVVLILTDDQGWGDLSRNGNTNLCTPRIDQLAAAGAVLEWFAGFCCGHWSHYFDSTIERNGVEVKSEGYLPDALTDQALAFIDSNRDQLFFCYLSLNTPHSPFQVPDEYFDRFRNHTLPLRAIHPELEIPDETRSALAMCENIDWNVGRVVDRLEELGLQENTIVVYFSDNGPNTWRWNGGMSGKKGDAEEGGVRSSCSITWPGHIAPGTIIDRIAGGIDLFPTLADFCALDSSVTKPLDGVSLRPLLLDECSLNDWPERKIFARQTGDHPAISVRTQEFRAGGALGGLYRLAADLGQTEDLAEELPEEHRELMDAIADWDTEMPVTPVFSALPVGYDEFPHAYIPTQDAELQGVLKRSSIHTNCSYIMDWEDAEATLTWNLDVKQTGLFDVELMYACSAEFVGSVLELRSGSHAVQAAIEAAFDSPVLDKNDRVPRLESYEKAFTPLHLGRLELEKGCQPLVLRCLHKAGKYVGELRALKLTWTPSSNERNLNERENIINIGNTE